MRALIYLAPALIILVVLWLVHLALTARLRRRLNKANELLDEVLDVAYRNREIDHYTAPVIIDEIIPKRRELNQ